MNSHLKKIKVSEVIAIFDPTYFFSLKNSNLDLLVTPKNLQRVPMNYLNINRQTSMIPYAEVDLSHFQFG